MGGGASTATGRGSVPGQIVAVGSAAVELLAPAIRQVHESLPEVLVASTRLVRGIALMAPQNMNEAIEMIAIRLRPIKTWDSLLLSLPTASRPIFKAASVHSGITFREAYTLERLDLALTIVEHHTEKNSKWCLGGTGEELLPWSVAMVNFHRLALHRSAHD